MLSLLLSLLLGLLLGFDETVGKVGVKTGDHGRQQGNDDDGDKADGHPAVAEDRREEGDRAHNRGGQAGGVLLEVLAEGDVEDGAVEEGAVVGGSLDSGRHGREFGLEGVVQAGEMLLHGDAVGGDVHPELRGHGKVHVERLEVQLVGSEGAVVRLGQRDVEDAGGVCVEGAEVLQRVWLRAVADGVDGDVCPRRVRCEVLVVVVVPVVLVRDVDVEVEHGRLGAPRGTGLEQHKTPPEESCQHCGRGRCHCH